MKDAYNYAFRTALRNRYEDSSETPQYCSTNQYLGEELAFDFIPPSVDLWIRHSETDIGRQPVSKIYECWSAPEVSYLPSWNGSAEESYKNKYFNPAQLDCDMEIKTKVHNKGWKRSAEDSILYLFWSYPNLNLNFMDLYSTNNDSTASGGIIGTLSFPGIDGNSSSNLTHVWKKNAQDANVRKSFKDMIIGLQDAKVNRGIGIYASVANQNPDPSLSSVPFTNGSALKMEFIIPKSRIVYQTEVLLSNPTQSTHEFSLSLSRPEEVDSCQYDPWNLELELESGIRQSLPPKDYLGSQIQALDTSDKIYMDWNKGELKGLKLNPGQKTKILIRPVYGKGIKNLPLSGTHRCIRDLVMKDGSGEICGANRFIFESPSHMISSSRDSVAIISASQGFFTVNCNTQNSDDFIIWRDNNNKIIGNCASLIVPEKPGVSSYWLSKTNQEGETLIKEVQIVSNAGIKNVLYDSAAEQLNVTFNESTREGDMINIVGITPNSSTTPLQYNLPDNEFEISVEGTNLNSGIYKVSYLRNGAQWSTTGFMVK